MLQIFQNIEFLTDFLLPENMVSGMDSEHCYILCPALTHLPLDKVALISQTIFSYAFSWMKNFVFWLKFVPKGQINNNPVLVKIMIYRHPGDKPLAKPMMVSLLTQICVTRPQWVDSTAAPTVTTMRYLTTAIAITITTKHTTHCGIRCIWFDWIFNLDLKICRNGI